MLVPNAAAGTTPFAAKNYLSTYKKIAAYSKQGKMKWHIDLTQDVQSLMQGLLMAKPDKRFGTTEGGIKVLKDHAWFNKNGFSWEALYNKTIAAPFVPVVTGSTDLQYFNPEDGVLVRPFCSPPRPESSACAADTRPRP